MPAADVALGDRHDEPQVRLGELALGELAVALHRLRGSARWLSPSASASPSAVERLGGVRARPRCAWPA